MLHPIRISSRGRIFNVLDGKRRMVKYGSVRPSLPYQGIARRALTDPLVSAAIQFHIDFPISKRK